MPPSKRPRRGSKAKASPWWRRKCRNLAEQSKQATIQVRSILNDIQKATNAAVMVTEQGSKAVEAGVKQSVTGGGVGAETRREHRGSGPSRHPDCRFEPAADGGHGPGSAGDGKHQDRPAAQNVASTRQTETAAKNIEELGRKLADLVALYKVNERSMAARAS